MAAKDDVLREARERYDAALLADRHNVLADMEDRAFVAGEQYTPAEIAARQGRPRHTENRLPQFIKQVTGDMRQHKPEIRALPVDDESDPKLAEVISAIVRHIESNSSAHRIYVKAAEHAVTGGIGWWRVITDYIDDTSFDQDILVDIIRNPLSVVIDPDAVKLTREDMNFAFVTELVSRKVFEQQYPKANLSGFDVGTPGLSANYALWRNGDFIRKAEYWTRERDGYSELALCKDGSVVDITDKKGVDLSSLDIQQTRKRPKHKVKWRTITASDILDEGDWAGTTIPLVPVIGEEIEIGDRTIRHGLIRFAKDPQRALNYFMSSAIEHVALQPKTPFVVTAKQIQNHRAIWDNLNVTNPQYVLYDHDSNAPGPPQRISPPTTPTAMIQMAQLADAGMKATTGIYDASLGAKSNETSGVAIQARDHQGETGTYVYTDNMIAGIERTGRIFMELIPKIYTTERVVRIIGEDGSIDGYQRVNKMMPDGTVMNDLSVAKYDIVVSTGPEYATKRQMAADAITKLMQNDKQLTPIVGDLLVKALDIPYAQKIADRLSMMLPPGIDPAADKKKAEAQQEAQAEAAKTPPTPQQQAQQKQQAEQAQAAEIMMTEEVKTKVAMARKINAEADLAEAQATLAMAQAQAADGTLKAQIDQIVHDHLYALGHAAGMGADGDPLHPSVVPGAQQAPQQPQQAPQGGAAPVPGGQPASAPPAA